MLKPATPCNSISYSRVIIDAPSDVRDEVAMDIPVGASRIDLIIAHLAGEIDVRFTGWMVDVVFVMFTEVFVIEVFIVVVASEMFVRTEYDIDLRAAVEIGLLVGIATDFVTGIAVDLLADAGAKM